jgi:replicative superfamily II helicase
MTSPIPYKALELQLNAGALLSLLGGSEEDRWRFWEIFKGITSRATFEILNKELEVAAEQVSKAQDSVRTVLRTVAVEGAIETAAR